jgi:hypothetical protein
MHSMLAYLYAVFPPEMSACRDTYMWNPGWHSAQGEMGATVFYHSREWLSVAQELKGRIGTGHVRAGVGINNAKVSGSILIPIVDHREYLAKFPAAFEAVKGGW